jgi:Ca2+-binding EF-hand superfamily protein
MVDAFRIFDIEGKGWVTLSEIKEGLRSLNFFAD